MRWLGVVVLVGCYSPREYASCRTVCSTNVDCPPGLVCTANLCRTGASEACGDAVAGADDDGDGIPNGVDLCPGKNTTNNHDHDADGVGDACDPCPHRQGPLADRDNDGDGVGNACDPQPDVMGEQFVAFYGFYDDAETATWTRGGSWSTADGTARGNNETLGNASFELPTELDANLVLTTSMSVFSISTTSEKVGGISARRTSPTTYQACHLVNTGAPSLVRYRVATPQFDDGTIGFTGGFQGTHEVVMSMNRGQVSCAVDGQLLARTITMGGPGKIALDTSFSTVSFDYLFVIRLP